MKDELLGRLEILFFFSHSIDIEVAVAISRYATFIYCILATRV
jgi:hypothetical protein